MSDQLSITFDARSQETIRYMQAMPQEMLKAIARGMDKGLALALGKITRERFTGKGPFPVGDRKLGVRSNRLRSSLRWNVTGQPGQPGSGEPSKINGQTVTGSMGSNVEYAGVHEYGFTGEVQVRSFRRQVSPTQFVKKGLGVLKGTKKLGKEAFKLALGMEGVRAHRRRMNVPERAPLRTGLADHGGTITQQISTALQAAWVAKGGR
jgi:hypothetical protein